MKITTKIILAILILAPVASMSLFRSSTNVEQVWVQRFNGPDNLGDGAMSIVVDDSGNVYVTGISSGDAFGTRDDYATIKYSPSGTQLWVQRYNGIYNGFDWAYSIAVDDSSNVLVTGRADGVYATIKYSPAGVMKWIREYTATGVSDTNIAYVVKTDRSGNVYVTGTSTGAFGTFRDYATVKYNFSGVQQWVARYNGPVGGYDEASSLAVDDSGNVYVTGVSLGTGTQQTDIATVKYNSSGVQQWVQRYVGAVAHSSNKGNSIALDDSGNVYVTGTGTITSPDHDYITIKYNSVGVQQWVGAYNGIGGYDVAYSITVDYLGNSYVTGHINIGAYYQIATVKYNTSGVQQWDQRFVTPTPNTNSEAFSITLDTFGNIYVAGYSNLDYVTIKYTPSGILEWDRNYNGTGNGFDGASSIALDKQANVYVTGQSWGQGTQQDYATVKYSQPVGIQPVTGELPTEYKLYQNFPNPFNPVTTIYYSLPYSSFVSIIVYDVLGRKVKELVNEHKKAGNYDIKFDGLNLASGLYIYRLETPSYTDVKKMLLIK